MGAGAAEVYLRLAPAVLGYLRAERAPELEDLLGEVFLQVARDLGRFDTVGAVKSLQVRALENLRQAVSLPA